MEGDEVPFDGKFRFKPEEIEEGWTTMHSGEFCPEQDDKDMGDMDDKSKPPPPNGGETQRAFENHPSTDGGNNGDMDQQGPKPEGSGDEKYKMPKPMKGCKPANVGESSPFKGFFVREPIEISQNDKAPREGKVCRPMPDDKDGEKSPLETIDPIDEEASAEIMSQIQSLIEPDQSGEPASPGVLAAVLDKGGIGAIAVAGKRKMGD